VDAPAESETLMAYMVNFLVRYYDYSKTRFPIVPLILHCGLSALVLAAVSGAPLQDSLVFGLLYLLFLLHMRVLDEYKDKDFDDRNYPDRPVQLGSVSLPELKGIGWINAVVFTAIGLLRLIPAVWLFIFAAAAYSFLMFKEFFIQNFWQRSPAMYLLSHQAVLILLFLGFAAGGIGQTPAGPFAANILFVYATVLNIELGRKIKRRYAPDGAETIDTYAYVWGQQFTINLIVLVGVVVFVWNALAGNILWAGAIWGSSIYLLLIGASFIFRRWLIDNAREIAFVITLAQLFMYLVFEA